MIIVEDNTINISIIIIIIISIITYFYYTKLNFNDENICFNL